jgi:hypothetical protein
MSAHRRWTLGLFAAGAFTLLVGTALLQRPPREPVPRPVARKAPRTTPAQRRGEAGPLQLPVAWNLDGPHVARLG